MRLARFFVVRIISMIVTLFFVVVAVFSVMYFQPGGTYATMVSNHQTGIFANYMQSLMTVEHNMFTFNFHLDPKFWLNAVAVSSMLAFGSIIIAAIVGLPIGIVAAVRKRNWLARIASTGGLVAQAIPAFTLAVILDLIFGVFLKILPLNGWTSPKDAILPMITLAAGNVAYMAKFMQSGMNEALGQDFVMSAKARGLPQWKVVMRHALRPAIVTLITFFGPQIPILIASTVVVEDVFQIPGMSHMFGASLYMGGVESRPGLPSDLTIGVASLFVLAIMIMLMNLIVDLVYRIINPRLTV